MRIPRAVLNHHKDFTEPVALLSTRPSDLPLPRTAARLSFDLLALRARCVEEPMGDRQERQGHLAENCRTLRRLGPPTLEQRTVEVVFGVLNAVRVQVLPPAPAEVAPGSPAPNSLCRSRVPGPPCIGSGSLVTKVS
jgi:hypothetical protein